MSVSKKTLPKAIRPTTDEFARGERWARCERAARGACGPPGGVQRATGQSGCGGEAGACERCRRGRPGRRATSSPAPAALARTAPMGAGIDATRRRSQANAIVERHAAYAAVGGIIPVPIANVASITAVIVRMVKLLSDLYGIPFERDRARAIVVGLMGGAMPTGLAAVTTSTLVLRRSGKRPHRPRRLVHCGGCMHPQHRPNFRRALRKRVELGRSSRAGENRIDRQAARKGTGRQTPRCRSRPSADRPRQPTGNDPNAVDAERVRVMPAPSGVRQFFVDPCRARLRECGDIRPRARASDAGRGMRRASSGGRSRRSSCVEAVPAAAGKAWLPTPHPERPWPRPRTDNRALAGLRGRCRGAAARRATVSWFQCASSESRCASAGSPTASSTSRYARGGNSPGSDG